MEKKNDKWSKAIIIYLENYISKNSLQISEVLEKPKNKEEGKQDRLAKYTIHIGNEIVKWLIEHQI